VELAINRKGMRICEKTKNNDKMLSELKDQGNKLQQEKNDAASDEVIKKIINKGVYYACQWVREAFCPDTRDEYQKCFTIILMT
jgi:hypothetical protein